MIERNFRSGSRHVFKSFVNVMVDEVFKCTVDQIILVVANTDCRFRVAEFE